jgi:hypothetical protein
MHVDTSDDVYERPAPTSRPVARRTLTGTITGPPGGEIRVRGTVSVKSSVPAVVHVALSTEVSEETRFGLNPRDDGTASANFDVPARLWSDSMERYAHLMIRVDAVGESPLGSASIVGSFKYQPTAAPSPAPPPDAPPPPAPEPETPIPAPVVTPTLGYDMPWSAGQAIPLRLHVSVSEPGKYSIVGVCELEQSGSGIDPGDRSTYLFERSPCESYDYVTQGNFDYTGLDVLRLGPLNAPLAATVKLRVDVSDGREISAVVVETPVRIEAAATLYVVREGGPEGESMAITIDPASGGRVTAQPRTYVRVWWGDVLVMPVDSAVAIRFLDGSAGLIIAHGISEIYESIGMSVSADDMGFQSNSGLLDALDIATSRNQEEFVRLLAGRLAGPLGAILDVVKDTGGGNPAASRTRIR